MSWKYLESSLKKKRGMKCSWVESYNSNEFIYISIGLLFLYGPSGSGKSTFVKNFLRECEHHFDKPVDRIVYFYSIWHGVLQELKELRPDIEFVENTFPDSDFFNQAHNNIVIYDDLIIELSRSGYLTRLSTKLYTKYNCFVIVLSQILFHASEGFKSLTSNATNLVLFKHRRSRQQINIFLRQIGSGNLSSVYHNVTGSLPFSYLAIDLHPQSVAEFKVYSHMLYCEEKSMVLFDCE